MFMADIQSGVVSFPSLIPYFAWALWESIDCSGSANDVTTSSSHDSFLEANCSLCICIWFAIIAIVKKYMWEPITSIRVFTWVGTCEEGQRRTANNSWKFETLREFPDTLYRSIICWYIHFLSLEYTNYLINWNFCNFAAYLCAPLCWFPFWTALRPWLITVLSSYHWARWRLSLQFVNSYRVFAVLHSCVNKCVHRLRHPGAARMIERRGFH